MRKLFTLGFIFLFLNSQFLTFVSIAENCAEGTSLEFANRPLELAMSSNGLPTMELSPLDDYITARQPTTLFSTNVTDPYPQSMLQMVWMRKLFYA